MVRADYPSHHLGYGNAILRARRQYRTVAVTPGKAMSMDPAEVKHICDDCTVAGFKAMCDAVPAKPFRFFYFSGAPSMLDSLPKSFILGDYSIMRVSRPFLRNAELAWAIGQGYALQVNLGVSNHLSPFCRPRLHGKSRTFPRRTRMSK